MFSNLLNAFKHLGEFLPKPDFGENTKRTQIQLTFDLEDLILGAFNNLIISANLVEVIKSHGFLFVRYFENPVAESHIYDVVPEDLSLDWEPERSPYHRANFKHEDVTEHVVPIGYRRCRDHLIQIRIPAQSFELDLEFPP